MAVDLEFIFVIKETAEYVVNTCRAVRLQIRARHVLPAMLFLVIIILNVGISVGVSLQTTISSQGGINYGENSPCWGVVQQDNYWGPPWGLFFTIDHINMVKDANGTFIFINFDMKAWEVNDSDNILGIPFHNYTEQIVDWCHQAGLKVIFSQAVHSDFSGYEDRADTMRNASGAFRSLDQWINWGCEMIARCEPEGIMPMEESLGPTQMENTGFTEEDYLWFLDQCRTAYRAVDPNLELWIFGLPYTDLNMFDPELGGSLYPYDDIVYLIDRPYYQGSGSGWRGYYYNGQLEEAKADLYADLDWRFGTLKGSEAELCLVASVAEHEGLENLPNWDACMKDAYDYCLDNEMYFMQLGMNKRSWNLITPDHTQWNEVGEWWAENVP